ncbi:MAG: DASS family sodium-coupled anion symporter [Candidatus Caenarcaniphilales bacterium]|nr:DASS family sodium-coupled anion symporter [Candidatus Caenarcaniphilales bacterium]
MTNIQKILANKNLHILFCFFAAFLAFLLPESCPIMGKKALAITIFSASLWALELLPLHVTSLLVIILEILFLSSSEAGNFSNYEIFLIPFASPVIILFLGGFVLAAVFEKYKIDKEIAAKLINIFGKKPYPILVGFLLVTAILSMWLSNTATAALMLSIITPFLNSLKKEDPFKTALVLAIAFGANIGGIATPIGTPPNAIALGLLNNEGIKVSFSLWVLKLFPLMLICLFIASIVLHRLFKTQMTEIKVELKGERLPKEALGVITIASLTIFLWLTSGVHGIPEAAVALLAITAFSFLGYLTSRDLKILSWDILILIWGGLALGQGLQISGFADWLLSQGIFSHQGIILVIIFSLMSIILSSIVSNTVAANLIMPIALKTAGADHLTLAMIIAISCSFAIVLPISNPPNAIAFSSGLIKSRDMLKAGIIISSISLIVTIAYQQLLSML